MDARPLVHLEQIIGIPLPEHVHAMARDAITRRVDCHPWLAAQGELNHYGSVLLAIHAVIVREKTRSQKQYYACAN